MAQRVVIQSVIQTTALQYGSMTVKFNTCDFTLINPSSPPVLGTSVLVKDPGWAGTVARIMQTDIVDVGIGQCYTTVSATNTAAVVARPTPFNISDQPSATAVSHFLLEDGSGALVLEDGSAFAPGDYALESSGDSYGYRSLSLETQTNSSDGSVSTKLTATIFQPGLWPGMSLNVKSFNFGFPVLGSTYVVSQVTTTWTAGTPTFVVEMTAALTESLNTLSKWRVGG